MQFRTRVYLLLLANMAAGTFSAGPVGGQSGAWSTLGVYRGSMTSYRNSRFNPDGFSVNLLNFPTTRASLLQRVSWSGGTGPFHFTAAWRGEARYAGSWEADGILSGLTVETGFGRWVVLAGRSFIRWGTGYAFNPTDFVAPEKSVADPENRDGRQTGRDLVKLEYFGNTVSLAGCLVFPRKKSLPDPEHPAAAVRFYWSLGSLDLSLLARWSGRAKPMWGINTSCVLGDRFEFHSEALFNSNTPGPMDMVSPAGTEYFTPLKSATASFWTLAAGFQITLPWNIHWISEYFHIGSGIGPQRWNGLMERLDSLAPAIRTDPLAAADLLFSMQLLRSGRCRRDYLFTYVDIPLPGSLRLRPVLLTNLADGSSIFYPELTLEMKNTFTLFCRGCIFEGARGSEYGEMFQSFVLEGGVRFTR